MSQGNGSLSILIIDDNELNQKSARQTLAGHDLTIAKSYEEGLRLLTPLNDHSSSVRRGEIGYCYDVVLCDLLMPATGMMLSDQAKKKFEGEEQPLGWALLLRAVLNGARYAAVVSSCGHHDHPAGYAMEAIDNADDNWGDNPSYVAPLSKKPQFVINGATVGFFNSPSILVDGTVCPTCNGMAAADKCQCVQDEGSVPDPTCWMCNGKGVQCYYSCSNSGKLFGKDWGLVLKVLLEG